MLNKDELTYRNGVIGVVLDGEGNFLVTQHTNYRENEWRFPGGGVEVDELAEKALLRELKEELGTNNFQIIKQCTIVNQFDWPDEYIEKIFKKKGKTYKGQRQVIFLVSFLGTHEEIQLQEEEIRKVKWLKREDLPHHLIFPNQWEVMEKALKDLLD